MAIDRGEEAADACWTDAEWFIDNLAGEAKCPMVPESGGHTAALFCIEDFGVSAPPETGWVPRDKVDSSRSGSKEKQEVEWYRNTKTAEWIFHNTESMYYHLPTSSLWERRSVECSDPNLKFGSFTYCRVDSNALQALSRFAMSLDGGLLPMTFKAWVRYMRKKKDRHFGVPAPPGSPGPTKKVSEGQETADESGLRFEAASYISPEAPLLGGADGGDAGPENAGSLAPAVVMDAAKAVHQMRMSRSQVWVDTENEQDDAPHEPRVSLFRKQTEQLENLMDQANPESGSPSVSERPDRTVSKPSAFSGDKQVVDLQDPSAKENLLDSDGEQPKGLLCLRCFKSSRKVSKRKADAPTETAPENPNEQSSTAPAPTATVIDMPTAAGPDSPVKAQTTAVPAPVAAAPAVPEEAKYPVDTAERHVRRLDAFLELVTRSPQKLVDHIEKRRQGKTTSLGMFVA